VTLQRLVLDFRSGELVIRCLYRSRDGAGPSTKARAREVAALVRTGLEQALEALRAYCRAGRDEALRIRRGAA
jgi:hypothetical protein